MVDYEVTPLLVQRTRALRILFILLFTPVLVFARGDISPNIRIDSNVLGYALQYKVYTPTEGLLKVNMPVLFVTDGPGYISGGLMDKVAERLLNKSKIDPAIIVFVDARNPDNLEENRRNSQFFCNQEYLKFYTNELIPAIEESYPVTKNREARSILDVSFGGLNAACFGLLGADTFSGIAMHSPANHPIKELLPSYRNIDKLPLKIFLSTGVPNDNTRANRAFRDVLKKKGYELKYIETDKGHNWENWRPLVDDVLLYFYGNTNTIKFVPIQQ